MKQHNVKMREMQCYPCNQRNQQLLDQDSKSLTSENELQGAWMDDGEVRLRGVVQWCKNKGPLELNWREIVSEEYECLDAKF